MNARTKTILSTLAGAATGTIAAWASLPASTPPIKSKGSKKSVALLEPVQIHGAKLWTLQRGTDITNPLLLYVHGGPGMSELALNRSNTSELESYYTVVNYDQRGSGKAHAAIRDKSRMHMDKFVADLVAVVRYLLQKFGQQKLTLLGRSWGTAIGMLAIDRHPELFDAYVGIGQLTNVLESERASHEWALEQALRYQDRKAIKELTDIGFPPYTGDWLKKFMTERKYVIRYGGEVAGNPHGGNLKLARSALFGQEYNLADRLAYFAVAKQSLRLLQPQLMQTDLFREVPAVQVPVFFMAGRQDHVVPQIIARRYYEMLQAPYKEWHWFEHAAHMVDFEEREKFIELMLTRVRPFGMGQAQKMA